MTAPRGLVLDANILMRAVLGRRVLELLQRYEDVVEFYSPDVCFDDARFYLAQVLRKRGLDPNHGERVLTQVSALVHPVDISLYTEYERLARERIEIRDPDDWPIVAAAMLLESADMDRRPGLLRNRPADLDHRARGNLLEGTRLATVSNSLTGASLRRHLTNPSAWGETRITVGPAGGP